MDWKIEINIYVHCCVLRNYWYGTGNSTQCSVVNYVEANPQKRDCMICIAASLALQQKPSHRKQLYSNLKQRKKIISIPDSLKD